MLAGGIAASTIAWDEGPVEISADDALTVGAGGGTQSAHADAEDFLMVLLGAGSVPAKEVKSEGSNAGISWAAIRRAASGLGVRSRRIGGVAGRGNWVWELGDEPSHKNTSKVPRLIQPVSDE